MSHRVRDCPEEDTRGNNAPGNGSVRVCHGCKEPGHFLKDCPKLGTVVQVTGTLKRAGEGAQPAAKRQAIQPRVYNTVAVGETSEMANEHPITGTLEMGGVATHVLFDSGATHCFVKPDMIGKGGFQKDPKKDFSLVRVAGGQVMSTLGTVRNISVLVEKLNMPADLIITQVKDYDVILGMDWLSKYKAHLDCHRGRIRFERENGKFLEYQGIRPISSSLMVSAMQAERLVKKGCEAYLATISIAEVGS